MKRSVRLSKKSTMLTARISRGMKKICGRPRGKCTLRNYAGQTTTFISPTKLLYCGRYVNLWLTCARSDVRAEVRSKTAPPAHCLSGRSPGSPAEEAAELLRHEARQFGIGEAKDEELVGIRQRRRIARG